MIFKELSQEMELMEIARQSIKKDEEYKKINKKPDTITEIKNKFLKADMGRGLYLEYDDSIFETKLAIDMLYYKNILKNLDESYYNEVHELLSLTYRNVKNIYEFVNIIPEIFGRGITSDILTESIDKSTEKIGKILNEVTDLRFYQLSPDQRYNKYSEKAIGMVKSILTEDLDPEETMQFCIKTCVLSEILTNIAFPLMSWSRIKYLSESEDFGIIFDQKKLLEMINEFESQINLLSRYSAASV